MQSAPPSTPPRHEDTNVTSTHPLLTEQKKKQNLSFVLEGIHKVKFEDRPIPALRNPHDVLINVKYTGICGSDVCTTKCHHAT